MPSHANKPIRAVSWSTCPHANVTSLSEEVFDLNVSASEDGDITPAAQPAPDQPSPAQPAPADSQPVNPMSISINNTDVQEGRTYTSDIRYFFEVTPTEKICKICQ
jgi:hypothetical protein